MQVQNKIWHQNAANIQELSGRNYDCGNSSGRQALLFPELPGRDEVHQLALSDKLRSSKFEKKTRSGLRQTRVRRPQRTRLRRRTNARIPRTWTSCALLNRIWTRVSTKSTSSRHISRSCRRSSTHCMMRKIFKILTWRVVQYPITSQACRLFSDVFLSSQPKPRLLKTWKLDSPPGQVFKEDTNPQAYAAAL